MDPFSHRLARRAPDPPRPRSAVRRPPKPRPEWNDLQQDHTRFRLSEEELQRRREERRPHSLNFQPLLPEEYVEIPDDKLRRISEEVEQKRSSLRRSTQEVASSMTRGAAAAGFGLHDPEIRALAAREAGGQNPLSKTPSPQPGGRPAVATAAAGTSQEPAVALPVQGVDSEVQEALRRVLSQEPGPSSAQRAAASGVEEVESVSARRAPTGENPPKPRSPAGAPGDAGADASALLVIQPMLQKLNRLAETVSSLRCEVDALKAEVEMLKASNRDKDAEIRSLRSQAMLQKELSSVNEYVAMEQVLDRLKFL